MKQQLLSILLAACLAASLCACGRTEEAASSAASSQASSAASAEAESAGAAVAAAEDASAPEESAAAPADESGEEAAQTATLYVGTSGTFKEYPVEYEGELTPVFLISRLSELTGWNLDLSDEVTSGKGGMTVSFAETSALVVGPPDPQTPDFYVYDSRQLVLTILDSVQHTLQYNFVDPELGDPSTLDIYFTLDGEAIVVPDSGETIDPYAPYQSLS